MLRLRQLVLLSAVAMTLSGCGGFEHGNGLSRLDTEDGEDKANDKWFGKFYGEKDKNCDDSFWSTQPFCNPE